MPHCGQAIAVVETLWAHLVQNISAIVLAPGSTKGCDSLARRVLSAPSEPVNSMSCDGLVGPSQNAAAKTAGTRGCGSWERAVNGLRLAMAVEDSVSTRVGDLRNHIGRGNGLTVVIAHIPQKRVPPLECVLLDCSVRQAPASRWSPSARSYIFPYSILLVCVGSPHPPEPLNTPLVAPSRHFGNDSVGLLVIRGF